jgi:magnesium chelatase subunit D
MTETKGTILSLLMDAYQKRDKIAMITFRGDHAEVFLPPTGSVEPAHKLLEELPTRGKTPLLSNRMGAKYFKVENLKADTLVEVLQENLLR